MHQRRQKLQQMVSDYSKKTRVTICLLRQMMNKNHLTPNIEGGHWKLLLCGLVRKEVPNQQDPSMGYGPKYCKQNLKLGPTYISQGSNLTHPLFKVGLRIRGLPSEGLPEGQVGICYDYVVQMMMRKPSGVYRIQGLGCALLQDNQKVE